LGTVSGDFELRHRERGLYREEPAVRLGSAGGAPSTAIPLADLSGLLCLCVCLLVGPIPRRQGPGSVGSPLLGLSVPCFENRLSHPGGPSLLCALVLRVRSRRGCEKIAGRVTPVGTRFPAATEGSTIGASLGRERWAAPAHRRRRIYGVGKVE